jgi:hypothetical protein
MKAKATYILFLIAAGMAVLTIHSCKEDPVSIPEASTQAMFTWQVDTLREGAAITGFGVQFTSQSILAQSHSWDFGNGQTSSEENPYVVYTESGQYTIRLTVTSAHDLHYNRLERTATITLATGALPLPYMEDFNSEEGIPEMITIWDLDGDGLTWYWSSLTGIGHLRSQSWDPDEGALTPDNWVITPHLELGSLEGGQKITLNYWVGVMANTPAFRQEHYGVFISDAGRNPEDFELLFEETFPQDTPRLTPLLRTIDISAYQGRSVFIAIRHYNVTDKDRMFLDKIEVVRN